MARKKIPAEMQRQVRRRAKFLCEYCHASEQWQYVQFTIDHIIPLTAGGSDDLENLALACFHCNRRKSNRQAVTDFQTGVEVALFNPRLQRWHDHFAWSSDLLEVVGLTPTGRATVTALALNRDRILAIRATDLAIGRHPPPDDQVESLQ
ncbi:HNH endonuclease signature motif containing protein [Pseudanabaena sp. FACHB-2040]|uniref:HNH endonuclease n=1 Tax=Pseudanabaena sp. FACHB-2040 TaxID=2692859 RepID=UPI001688AFCB|nr:HNH endonuclease signature motif containing protein [Pseudanabaena sp. FACHB-2040]MBD2256260.1 HNH endonuclease [Pseudanabaena sp. FACHB-2040]